MKTYTKLDTKEAFNKAMNSGKPIQYFNVDEWVKKYPGSDYYENTEYRTVEETKPKEGWIHPDALSPVRDCSGLIHVIEVLEDE